MTPQVDDENSIDTLVDANHVLFIEGVLDAFGHVSVRSSSNPNAFFIARSMAPALVRKEDILRCDLDGEVHDQRGRRSYVERFIHSEIYRARPEVQAIVHSHSPSVIPFGVTGTRLRPVCHMSGFLRKGSPLFDIREATGDDTDLLVSTPTLGKYLADALGNQAMVLMRGHGSTVVGTSLQQAVYRAVYAELNAKLQLQSTALGEVRFLSDGEAELTDTSSDVHLGRSWQLWVNKARNKISEFVPQSTEL